MHMSGDRYIIQFTHCPQPPTRCRTLTTRHGECIAVQRMVKFGWPVKTTKCSPPPLERDAYSPSPYREDDHISPVALPTTTTSAVPTTNSTTNTQATHFLSLPIWKRRQEQQVNPPQRQSMFDLRTYEAGLDHRPEEETSRRREKSLPPIPTSPKEDVSGAHVHRTDTPTQNHSYSYRPSRQTQSTTATNPTRPSPSQAKIALAQAALAIGLPHGMPQATASSSRSDVNSMAFVANPQTDRQTLPAPSVRRAKSFHQLSRKFSEDDNSTLAGTQRLRSRGTPFGPANASESERKGKGKALEDIPSHVTPPRKSLVRRASFWSRKRNDSLKPAVPPLPSEHPRNSFDRLSHMLPSLPPISPLYFDPNISRSSHSSQTEEQLPSLPPGLNPLSDALNRPLPTSPAASSSPDISVQALQTATLGQQRPSTADPPTDRSRTLSYHARPIDHSPPASAPSQHPEVATLRQAARPRSQTNPPFLYRLSANIFSFGSSSLLPPTSGASGPHTNHSPEASPRTSTSKLPPPRPRLNEESPVAYVDRLLGTISKADVASVLASRYDPFACELESRP